MIIYEGRKCEFYRMFAKLNGEIQKRAREALCILIDAKDPVTLGVRKGVTKKGPKCAIYAYEINRSYRILYCVGGDCLRFISVGDHKNVYGRD